MDKKEAKSKLNLLKKMQKENSSKGGHAVCSIVVDKELAKEYWYSQGRVLSRYVGEQVLWCLDDLSNGVYCTCSNCGGLIPEISFSYEHRHYTFTCTAIRDKDDKVIAETDYKILEKYCHALNTKAFKNT